MTATLIFRHDQKSTQGLQVPAFALKGLETLAHEGAVFGYDGEPLAMLTDVRLNSVASLFTAQWHSTAQAKTALQFIRERSGKGLAIHVQPIFADVKQRNNVAVTAYLLGFSLTNAKEPHKISLQALPAQPAKSRHTHYNKWHF
jgi:hypothetical protein